MRYSRKYLLATVSTAIFVSAIGGARADDNTELKAQIQALTAQIKAMEAQQQQLMKKVDETDKAVVQTKAAVAQAPAAPQKAASGPLGSFLIPGTNTTMKIGGYVKVDVVDDIAGTNNNGGTVTDFQSIAIDGTSAAARRGQFSVTARQSRLNIGTETPTSYGPLKAFVEGDFYGAGSTPYETNSSAFRFRHAYFSLGGFLGGQTWTNFEDIESIPETLDFGGSIGVPYGLRQGQIRYTYSFDPQNTLSVAIENPEGDFFGADHSSYFPAGGSNSTRVLNQYPDLTARYVLNNSWGRFSVAAVLREINVDTGNTAQAFVGANGNTFNFKGQDSVWGGGAMVSAKIPTVGKDFATFWFGGGPGIGRYFQQTQDEALSTGQAPVGLGNTNPGGGAVLDTNGELHTITSVGGNLSYRHYWMDTLRSNAIFGISQHYNDSAYLPVNIVRQAEAAHVNLIWSPIPATNFGVEYIWGHIDLNGQTAANKALGYGSEGTMHRVQFSAQYMF